MHHASIGIYQAHLAFAAGHDHEGHSRALECLSVAIPYFTQLLLNRKYDTDVPSYSSVRAWGLVVCQETPNASSYFLLCAKEI